MSDKTDILLAKNHNTTAHGIGMIIPMSIVIVSAIINGTVGAILATLSVLFMIVVGISWGVTNNGYNKQLKGEKKEE